MNGRTPPRRITVSRQGIERERRESMSTVELGAENFERTVTENVTVFVDF